MAFDDIITRGGRIEDGTPHFGYMPGFGNTFSTEAEEGALPMGRNSPQRPPMGLYGEQLSGTAFTAPRETNKRSWLYRILPSVRHGTGFSQIDAGRWRSAPCVESDLPSMQLRWQPVAIPDDASTTFLDGIATMTMCGDAGMQTGMAAHIYVATADMGRTHLQNSDGEMLFVPQQGAIRLVTELGILAVSPGEIAVVPRGMKFRVDLIDGPVRGYLCENYGQALTLPERGPIGANCLANQRDFLTPVAAYEDYEGECRLVCKTGGRLYETTIGQSPLDVVAWHGNYVPYKYDLRRFSPVGSILFDHPDPSIFTVLTSPSEMAGTANIDFVIFPDRWLVMEDTFRPPWYHMNVMSEFMGLIFGEYDAKPGGFVPGGMSLHNQLVAHGPNEEAYEKATNAELEPQKLAGTMAFMFETRFVQNPTAYAASLDTIDRAYPDDWNGLKRRFTRPD